MMAVSPTLCQGDCARKYMNSSLKFALATLAVLPVSVTAPFAGEMFPDKTVKMTYVLNCAECHGRSAEGSMEGPPLVNMEFIKTTTVQNIETIIIKGVNSTEKRYPTEKMAAVMPGFKNDLSAEEVAALARLVQGWNK